MAPPLFSPAYLFSRRGREICRLLVRSYTAPEVPGASGDNHHSVDGVLLAMERPDPHSGILALLLRGKDGREMEVLVDAESTLQHLAATFGSADAAVGQEIELSLDVFGFAGLRRSE